MAYLLSYTRLPVDSVIYDPRLAYSMHLAISEDLSLIHISEPTRRS